GLGASRCSASERRQYSPRSMPSWESVALWYGPATSAVTYGDSRRVVPNRTTLPPAAAGSALTTRALEMTSQSAGAVTVRVNSAFRSGWSKQAYTRLASAVSNWEYR